MGNTKGSGLGKRQLCVLDTLAGGPGSHRGHPGHTQPYPGVWVYGNDSETRDILKSLVKRGLVTVTEEPGKRPVKRYYINDKGMDAILSDTYWRNNWPNGTCEEVKYRNQNDTSGTSPDPLR